MDRNAGGERTGRSKRGEWSELGFREGTIGIFCGDDMGSVMRRVDMEDAPGPPNIWARYEGRRIARVFGWWGGMEWND